MHNFAEADTRELKRIKPAEGKTGLGQPDDDTSIAAVVDVETTGLDIAKDKVIELAIRRFKYNQAGQIVEIGKSQSWKEDPGILLPDEVTNLTGISDQDLKGCKIDERKATAMLTSASLIIAHNAAFDRPMIERRLPDLPQLRWACSCHEIDWRGAGLEGRGLGWLCAQLGWFFDAHRAEGDVDAVITLLSEQRSDGRTFLSELDESADSDSWLVEAVGASISTKDALRLRGYRWNPKTKLWWREVFERRYEEEEAWLAREVYSASKLPKAAGPRLTRMTAIDRYRLAN